MSRPDSAYLIDITNAADEWIRRCEEKPPKGVLTERVTLRVVLAASDDVHVDDLGHIAWRGGGQRFTAEPVIPERSTAP